MHILFLTQVLSFPLDAGPKIRAYYVLRHLSQQHEVTVVSFTRPTDSPAAVAHLQAFCSQVYTTPMPRAKWLDGLHLIRSLVRQEPFLIARDWTTTMTKCLAELLHKQEKPFDAIHADQLWMAPYALWIKQALTTEQTQHQPPRLVLDQHNAVYMIPQRLQAGETNPVKRALLSLEARKMASFEVETCRHFDHVVWVTQEDYQAVQHVAQAGQSVPNAGIIPICSDPDQETPLVRNQESRRITFLGGLHYPPNAQGICWFAEQVFPSILAEAPDAILTVIGKQPPQKLSALGIPSKNLEVTGFVEDPRPFLRETAAFIVPLQAGGGMRVKILDAWMWGVPIVSTTVGAEGINVCKDENILLADAPADFAHATLRLLQQPVWGQQMAKAGRRWVEQHYNWRTVYRHWDQVYL